MSEQCPQCGHATVAPVQGVPWCPACEWNLLIYAPARRPPPGWRLVDRLGHRLSVRLDRKLAAELAVELPHRPVWTAKRVALVVISAILLGAIVALFGLGVWLIVVRPAPLRFGLGLALVAIAIGLRPRLSRVPKRRDRLDPATAPNLFALVAKVAERIGARMPDHIVISQRYNASVRQSGFRRETTLTLGAPLWGTLRGQARVALLAHELGHTVNGDPNRGLLVQPALSTFRRLSYYTKGHHSLGWVLNPDRVRRPLFRLAADVAMWTVSRVFLVLHLGLTALGHRDHQRAEYLADHLALTVAGTDAAVELMDYMLLAPSIMRLLRSSVETEGHEQWMPLAQDYRVSHRGRIPHERQLSRRRTDLWDSHPPTGLRTEVLLSRAHREPGLVLPDAAVEHLDRELAFAYRALHRELLGTRDFRPRKITTPTPVTTGELETA